MVTPHRVAADARCKHHPQHSSEFAHPQTVWYILKQVWQEPSRDAIYACNFPGMPAVDASGLERTLTMAPDMSWEVEVFGTLALDSVLCNQQARPIYLQGWQ